MKPIIQIKGLSHSYGNKVIYNNLNLDIEEGLVFGIFGKNGVGKSTLINILMGYLKPKEGKCLVLGEASYDLPVNIKSQIALLHEGFIAYDFMSIKQYENFFAPFYKNWDKKVFYDLVDLMDLSYNQKLSTLSYGQKSQVILGTLFAQNAKLLIFDDYSMGLDVGYRKLFIEYLKTYIKENKKTVLLTSHIMGDLVNLIDEMIVVQEGGKVYKDTMNNFLETFRCYEVNKDFNLSNLTYHRLERYKDRNLIFTFNEEKNLKEIVCDFEEKFLGYVGKY